MTCAANRIVQHWQYYLWKEFLRQYNSSLAAAKK